jgi:hypothetical protein
MWCVLDRYFGQPRTSPSTRERATADLKKLKRKIRTQKSEAKNLNLKIKPREAITRSPSLTVTHPLVMLRALRRATGIE